jgi:hypothetical protein
MAQLVSFYLQQARNCGEAADAATLANQRGKFLDAQAAWQALADQTLKVQEAAAKREAARNAG